VYRFNKEVKTIMERVYNTASERSGYYGSRLHCFHILTEEKGVEWMINSSSYDFKIAMTSISDRIAPVKRVRAKRMWTDDEVRYITDNWSSKSYKEMAKEMGRTRESVKLKVLSLRPDGELAFRDEYKRSPAIREWSRMKSPSTKTLEF